MTERGKIRTVVYKLLYVYYIRIVLLEHKVHCDAFRRLVPMVLFLVLGCGLSVEGRVDETPLATNRGRGEGRGVQAELFCP